MHPLSLRAPHPAAGPDLLDSSPLAAAGGYPAPAFLVTPATPLDPGPGNLAVRTLVRGPQTNGQFSNVEVAVGPR
jgi:hypothetical protein